MYKPRPKKPCPTCGTHFEKRRPQEVYCSLDCAIWPRIKKGGPDECWPWLGGLVMGYGAGCFQKKRYKVSRFVLEQKLGRSLGKLHALHSCDNPACCNPEHLFAGTGLDNMRDKMAKGRGSSIPPCLKGESHGMAKLTEEDVRFIWANRRLGQTALGLHFGVAKGVIHKIFKGSNWGWLTKTLPQPQ